MTTTVVVHSNAGDELRLTFDGLQRIVIGRGAGSDVRVPDGTVSHRHAILRPQGADLAVVDEGSSNGTYVGGVRVAAGMSRLVRSGDWIRVGRVWLRLVVDQSPITRNVALATRDLALAFVEEALRVRGLERSPAVRVVEGPDQGASLPLAEEGKEYVIGRGVHCDLPLADADVSREHARVLRSDGSVYVRDLEAKNGTWLGDLRVPSGQSVAWRSVQMLKMGGSVLALVEPVIDALEAIERAEDEMLDPEESVRAAGPPVGATPRVAEMRGASPDSLAGSVAGPPVKQASSARAGRWSLVDLIVMGAAVAVLGLSLVGLFWLFRSGSATPGR
jgi:pSer/pThr/pTyr-binding forkhead associated (FHA) protein